MVNTCKGMCIEEWLTACRKHLLPWQLKPSPAKPTLQAHVYEPGLFVHVAAWWHGLLLHSLISTQDKI